MRKAFVEATTELLDKDERVVVLLGDIGVFGFSSAIKRYPDRVYNIGILEQSTVSVASGFALAGYIPIIHTIAPFMVERACEQIKVDFGYQDLGGNIVTVGASYDYTALGGTHHCPGDAGILLSIPDIEIYVPGTPQEFSSLFKTRYDSEKMSYFRLSENPNPFSQEVAAGKGIVIRTGTKGVVIAVGPMLGPVTEATTGMDVAVLYITSVRPFAHEIVRELSTIGPVVVVEPFYEGTLAPQVMEASAGQSICLTSVGVPRRFIRTYGSFDEQSKALGLDTQSLRQRIARALGD